MTHRFAQSFHRVPFWMALVSLVVLSAFVAACGGTTTSTSNTPPSSSASNSVTTVTIAEKTGGNDVYSFDPQTITIKAGTTVKWVNNSDENHLLASSPALAALTTTSIVTRSGSNDNTFSIAFSTPGTYTISSTLINRIKDAAHPEGVSSQATLTITVS